MTMCVRRQPVVPSKKSRSSVSNGSRLLQDVDARSAGARRFRDLVASLSQDLGENLSEADLALVRQAASLIQRGEQLQADIANGKDVDPDTLTKLAGASRRSLAALSAKGIERKPAPGQTLQEFLAARAAAAAQSNESDDEDE